MPTPIARWNPARSVWETNETLICGHSDVWSETFPSSGMWAGGLVYELPTSAHRTAGSGSLSQPGLLPTPRTTDGNGAGHHGQGGMDLRTTVTLLPTPKATDGMKGGPNQRGSSGDLMLPSAVMGLAGDADADQSLADESSPAAPTIPALLPTPTATPYGNNQSPSPGAKVRPSLDSLAPSLAQPADAPSSFTTSADSAPAPAAEAAPIPNGDVLLLPTPTATGSWGMKEDGSRYGPTSGFTLTDAARTLLPTPTAADAERTSATYERGNPTLIGALTDRSCTAGSECSDE